MTSLIDNPAPSVDPKLAESLALEVYGLHVIASPLEGERDANFRLEDKEGRKFVLKVANQGESFDSLELQDQVLTRLRVNAPELKTPTVIVSLDEENIATVEIEGTTHLMRLVSWVEGKVAADVPKTFGLLADLGGYLAKLDLALEGLVPSGSHPPLLWDLQNATTLRKDLDFIADPEKRLRVERVLDQFDGSLKPQLDKLPKAVIHNDANDWNVLVASGNHNKVAGLIDFGDLVYSCRICELAVALPYFLFDQDDVLTAARTMVAAYNTTYPLTDVELSLLWGLIQVRLATTIVVGEKRASLESDNAYHLISLKPAWELLIRMQAMNAEVSYFAFRAACGLTPSPNADVIEKWFKGDEASHLRSELFDYELATVSKVPLDFRAGGLDLGDDEAQKSTKNFTKHLFARIASKEAQAGIGFYGEDRVVYRGDQFTEHAAKGERRSIHTGIDVFDQAGVPVYAPFDGEVVSAVNNEDWLDYGPTIILRHKIPGLDHEFFTLYGHLALESLEGLEPGVTVSSGDRIAWLGNYPVNGDWPPHLHFQIMTSLLGLTGNFPGVAPKSQWDVWSSICINPNLIMKIPEDFFFREES